MKNTYQVGFLLLFLGLSIGASAQAKNYTSKINYPYGERIFIVHVPANYNVNKAIPVVLIFHGGSNARDIQDRTEFDRIADTAYIITVYPQAKVVMPLIDRTLWADKRGTKADIQKIDDVKFTNDIIDYLISTYTVDITSIYAAGLSAGGYFCQRLALEVNHRIAAFACVGASMTTALADSLLKFYPPSRKIPLLYMNGTADTFNRYGGGPAGSIGKIFSTETTVSTWKHYNNCAQSPEVVQYPDKVPDTSTVTQIRYYPCQDCSEVVLYRINNGGHTWPGGFNRFSPFGRTNKDIHGSREIWAFFKRHHLRFPLNAAVPNMDLDLLPDLCDNCPGDKENDADGDSKCGNVDNCPTVSNTGQEDMDGDGIGDACDALINFEDACTQLTNIIKKPGFLHPNMVKSLGQFITNSIKSCNNGAPIGAVKDLNDFINHLNASRSIAPTTNAKANQLIKFAQDLIDAIEQGRTDC